MLWCDGLMLWLIPVFGGGASGMHPSCFVLSTGAEESADTVHLGHLLLHFSKPTSCMCQMLAGMAHAGNMRCSGAAQNRKCLTYFINSFPVRLWQQIKWFNPPWTWPTCGLSASYHPPDPLARGWEIPLLV